MKKVRLGSKAPWPLLSPATFSLTRWWSLSLQCPSLLCSLRSTRAACWKEIPSSISPQGRYTQGKSGEGDILLVPIYLCTILQSLTPVPQSSSVPTGMLRLTMEELPFICRTVSCDGSTWCRHHSLCSQKNEPWEVRKANYLLLARETT